VAGAPVEPVAAKLWSTVLHARVLQMSTWAPVVPLARTHRIVGACDVTSAVDSGATGWGGATVTHVPALQASFVPQTVPAGTSTGEPHVCVPLAHDVVPVSQGLPPGLHDVPDVQAVHTPLSQTSFVPHDVPSGALVPRSVQVATPPEQVVDPSWHASVGVQGAPVVHGAQEPLSQYALAPHDVPLGRLAPAVQTGSPELHTMVIAWHEPPSAQL
jgi:hypothetical protein